MQPNRIVSQDEWFAAHAQHLVVFHINFWTFS